MYAITSCPFVNRTFATLRSAEFGFFGVRVITCTHTPRRCGQLASAGDFDFTDTFRRPFRINWLIVGISSPNKAPPETVKSERQKTRSNALTHCHAPDAVSREYRVKIIGRKEYFEPEIVLRPDCAKLRG